MSATASIPGTVTGVVRPRTRRAVAEWAREAPFRIREKGAVRPGPYDISWTPFWRELLDAFGDPAVRKINVVASSQAGKTKAVEIGVAYRANHRPSNMLYVRPTIEDVQEAFRDRFQPMLQANASDLLPSGEWLKLTENPVIVLASMLIYGAAASIPRQLTSRTAPFVWYDETDTGGDTGNDLGNVLDQLEERQMAASAVRSQIVGSSTPKWHDGSNWLAWSEQSDAREYWEPCPHCGHYQPLVFSRLVTDDGDHTPSRIRNAGTARFACRDCGALIAPEWQGWMSDRGIWVPHGCEITDRLPLHDRDIVDYHALTIRYASERWEPSFSGTPRDPSHRGYRLWRANTKFDQATWNNILARWFEVHKSKDPQRLQVFVNNWLAEPWREANATVDEELIQSRIGEYEPRVVPTRAKVILGAVDLQQDHLWYLFRAFGPGMTSWKIDNGWIEVTNGDFLPALDRIYEKCFQTGWPIKGEATWHQRAYAIAVDSGHAADQVYEFQRRQGVIAIKGADYADYRTRKTQVEGKIQPEPVELYWLNIRVFGDKLHRLIRVPDGEPGEWNLDADTDQEYVRHLTAEELRPRRNSTKRRKAIDTWQLKSANRPNHQLDCERYTLGLAEILEQRQELSLMAMDETDPPVGVFRRGEGEKSADESQQPAGRKRPGARKRKGGVW